MLLFPSLNVPLDDTTKRTRTMARLLEKLFMERQQKISARLSKRS